MTLSDLERQLYAELVSCIALEMALPYEWVRTDDQENGEVERPQVGGKGIRFRHGWNSESEAPCYVLSCLGVAKGFDPYFEMKMDVESVGPFVSEILMASDGLAPHHPSLTKVIAAFVGLLSDLRGQITAERTAFVTLPEYIKVMDLLVKAGYAKKSGGAYQWTDKMIPPMRVIYEWDENGQPLIFPDRSTRSFQLYKLQRKEAAAEAKVAAIWRRMPKDAKDWVVAEWPVSEAELTELISKAWMDESFEIRPKIHHRMDLSDVHDMAKRLAKKIRN